MVLLQIIAVVINLIPVPPLDGFSIIAPYMDEETRIKLTTPPISTFAFIVLFLIVMNVPAAVRTGSTAWRSDCCRSSGFDYAVDRDDAATASHIDCSSRYVND